jgi:hypothetical protein
LKDSTLSVNRGMMKELQTRNMIAWFKRNPPNSMN